MKIQKLENGALAVPKRIEGDGIVGDAIVEIKPTQSEYQKYLDQYKREQELELNKK
ncbi:MAG: hypothetical protein AAB824_00215 [Patescibacteria group bacterium]